MGAEEALRRLRDLHRQYVQRCGRRFALVPFRARAVPGWTYVPECDRVERRIIMGANVALCQLRRLHREFVRRCGDRFALRRFERSEVPGWTYDPKSACVEWRDDP